MKFLILLTAMAVSMYTQARSITLDSGYIENRASNRAFWNFGLDYEGLGAWTFDGISEKTFVGNSPFGRVLLSAGYYFGWQYAQEPFYVSNHEFGHGTRSTAVGANPYYTWNNSGIAHDNIFEFFIEGFSTRGGAFATTPAGAINVSPPDNWSFASTAGGVNNSAMFAEALEDQINIGSGHILEYIAYVRSKQDAYNYVLATQSGASFGSGGTGDVDNLISSYSSRGIDVSYNDIKTGSQVSRWLSSTHWAYLYSTFEYISKGSPKVQPLQIGYFLIPNVSHYLMYKGLSYKVRTALVDPKFVMPFEVEYVYRGERVLEISTGFYRIKDITKSHNGSMGGQIFVNSSGAFGVKAKGDFVLGKTSVFSVGGSAYQSNLLEGERTISTYANTNLGYEIWGAVGYWF